MGAQASSSPAFGSVFSGKMAVAEYGDGAWQPFEVRGMEPLTLHPAAHVLQFSSSCFEGMKAYRHPDGSVRIFRLDRHVARMQSSAEALVLPIPDASQTADMVRRLVDANRDDVPEPPGSLYIRPILNGTSATVAGAAVPSREARLHVVTCPVGDYFAGGERPLTVAVDVEHARAAGELGVAKAGANYASVLGPILTAKRDHAVDQVLFCPGGDVQETGASNFLLLGDDRILTKSLDRTFLHGVTRDSILTLARDMDYHVEERPFTVDEMLEWIRSGEAALCGTAAVLAGVGRLIWNAAEHRVGDGGIGPNTKRLRAALVDIQLGRTRDRYGWLSIVE